MADLKFPCPSCHQSIVADELWCGQEIQCPSCQAQLIVPAQQAAEQGSSLVPKPPAGGASKLSIGRHEKPPGPPPSGQRFVPGSMTAMGSKSAKKKKVDVLKYVKVVVALIVLAAAGYFGYDFWTKRQAKKEQEAAAAAKAIEDANKTQRETAAANKPLPVVPPSWTLDVNSAQIPHGQANGSLGGTNFLVDSASITRSGAAQVLDLRQGTPSPDKQVMIYLHLNAGETLTNHTWTVSQEMKGSSVPQVLKRWKGPTGAMQQKFFSTGYAMKLELGQAADGTIPGKIFLALPDTEQSVVAGMFKVQPPSNEPVAAQPAAVQAPGAVPTGVSADKAAFEKRYGVKR